MFEKERAEIRILSNVADAQGMAHARDLLRLVESEFAKRDEFKRALREKAERMRREAVQ